MVCFKVEICFRQFPSLGAEFCSQGQIRGSFDVRLARVVSSVQFCGRCLALISPLAGSAFPGQEWSLVIPPGAHRVEKRVLRPLPGADLALELPWLFSKLGAL
eukprot:scaffold24531_cov62-Isochrysis_galbana.AAC.1